jgi:phosphoribosyl 1,2-cyclic phosphodiesterase
VTFWGVRGSIPTPGAETTRYGGNTLCIELEFRPAGRRVVIDAGSGIRRLGDALYRGGPTAAAPRLDLLLTHTHLDHILGLPFFRPLYDPRARVTVYGPVISPDERLEEVIGAQLSYRYFPVRQVELAAVIDYVDLKEGRYELGDGIRLTAAYLNHPLLCMGYRLEYGGRCVCTAFDTEPFRNLFITDRGHPDFDEALAAEGENAAREADRRMRAFTAGADLLIHDGQYTQEEYGAGKQGWGHSPVEYALALARDCRVRRLALVHHDPMRSDEEMDQLAARYAPAGGGPAVPPQLCFAHEGLRVVV